MKKITILTSIFLLMFVSFTFAVSDKVECDTSWLCSPVLLDDCKEFYDNDRYYTISTWKYNLTDDKFILSQQDSFYRYFKISFSDNMSMWNSNEYLHSVIIINSENNTLEYKGGFSGVIDNYSSVDELKFCGYRKGSSSSSAKIESSGVPEFSSYGLIAAIIAVTIGIIIIKKEV